MVKPLILAVLAMSFLAGCATLGPSQGGGAGRGNYAAGSALGASLGAQDQAALGAVFAQALERGESAKPASWTGPGASGSVTPGRYLVGNLWSEPLRVMPVSGRIDLQHPLETERGLHALTATANVRSAPAPDAPVLATLGPGAAIDAIGRTVGQPWMLVAVNGSVRGYVHESLMIKAPGSELELAGGPTRKPWRCREFQQQLNAAGQSDRWTGIACDRGQGWALAASEPRDAF